MSSTETAAKPKLKFRKRHFKKAVVITAYVFVTVVMIMGMVSPALMQ